MTDESTALLVQMMQGLQASISGGMSELRTALGQKADKEDVARIESTLSNHSERLSELETAEERDEAATKALYAHKVHRSERFRWAVTVVAMMLGGAGALLAVVHP